MITAPHRPAAAELDHGPLTHEYRQQVRITCDSAGDASSQAQSSAHPHGGQEATQAPLSTDTRNSGITGDSMTSDTAEALLEVNAGM